MARLSDFLLPLTISLGLIAGCQAPLGPSPQPAMSLDITPTLLAEPMIQDWSGQRVSGRQLSERREAHVSRQLLAFPATASGWTGGVALTSLGCAAGDYAPNGPASVFATKSTPAALGNKVFLLTKNGRFIRVDRNAPGTYTNLALGKTFSRTYVTLSPTGSRAYVVSDDGTFFVINTLGMTVLHQVSLGAGGYGIAPFLDPYRSQHNGSHDEIYVPDNAGYVNKYTVNGGGVSAATRYAVATTVTPLYGETRKIKAPAVVLGGVIYVGDQAGALRVYDTNNTANNVAFAVGAPINTSPAIEIQDGTYALQDTLGNPKTVPNGTPVYAFVSAGASCAWIDLHDWTITPSLSLHIDDFDPAKKFGTLHDYNYDNTSTPGTAWLIADWVNIRPEGGPLAGTGGAVRFQGDLRPAQANADTDGTGSVVTYMRWTSTNPPAGAIVNRATLTLAVSGGSNQWSLKPEIRTTSPYERDGGALWSGTTMTGGAAGTSPPIGNLNVGTNFAGGTESNQAPFLTRFPPNGDVTWDVTSAFTSGPQAHYALALAYPPGDIALWEPGPRNEAGGNPQRRNPVYSPNFRNGSDPARGPRLTLDMAAGTMPTPSIETPPVIDAYRKLVYVFYTNAVYQISFASRDAWADRDPANPQTRFQLARYGDTSYGGAMYNSRKNYVGNFVAPVVNYNLSAAYVLNRYPVNATVANPTAWNYSLSKIDLPLGATSRLAGSTTPITSVTNEASTYMIIDPFDNVGSTGGNVHFALGNGRVYQVTP